ncbi:MAG TPA: alpha-galactosidase [Tessaracoccus flavescens]|uniref:alpha-galactosidase n=1 Tax=Tessaracoccus flavescens TaxID=399497 RepID=A0A921EN76_9ACTN|nr:alpha-galactosidase [Tessaracoccus flavescens]
MTRLHLRANGVSLAVVIRDGLPEVVHWGADLGGLTPQLFDAVALGSVLLIGPNQLDAPPRYTVLLEGRYGWLGKPGLIGSRSGRDWTPDWRVTSVEVDGEPADGFVEAGPAVAVVTAEGPGLVLTLIIEMTPEGLVRLRGALRNTGDDAYNLQELTLALPIPRHATEILDFAGRWGVERSAQRTTLGVGQHRREGRRGRTGADAAYVLHAGAAGFGFREGEVWGVHTAFSGNHVHQAEADALGFQALSGGELLLAGEVSLRSGEEYETPWVFFNYGNGLDEQADRFHGWLRALPHAPAADRPVTLNVWEAVYFDHNLDKLTQLAEIAARVGIERYVLDDGWFGSRRHDRAGLGDWVVSPDVWPDGLTPLITRVNDLGMQFGLWIEPEMVNVDSDVARAHPEWIMQPAGRLPTEARSQQVLNLGIDGAWQHVFTQIDRVLTDHDIAYIKWDHNRDLVDAGSHPDGVPGVHAQTLAYYRLFDALRERHPDVEFESCSSGGGRIDLEVMTRAARVWVSDVIDPVERQRMLPWTGQLLPAEFMGSHIASARSHSTMRQSDLNFRAATAVFGHLGVEWDLTQVEQDELDLLADWIGWFKANRQVLMAGRQVRMDMPDKDVYFKGIVTDDKAFYSLSMLSASPRVSVGTLRFAGLNPDALYRVTADDRQLVPLPMRAPWTLAPEPVVLTGRALMTAGLHAPQLLPDTAVIFEVERVG